MLGLSDLENRIKTLFNIFKNKVKAIVCYLIDEDAFIIGSIKEEFLDKNKCDIEIIKLLTAIENLSSNVKDWIDYNNKWEIISYGLVDGFFNNGFIIIVKKIRTDITFLTILPTILDLKPIIEEFEKVSKELSIYFCDKKDDENWKNMYQII